MSEQSRTASSCACACEGEKLNPFCAGLPASVRTRLCEKARVWEVDRGSCASVHDISTSIVIVQRGLFVVCSSTKGDKNTGIMMCDPGHLLNVVRLADEFDRNAPYWNDAHWGYAALDAAGCQVPLGVFKELISSELTFAKSMVSQLIKQYRNATEYGVEMQDLGSEQRVAWFLDQLARRGVGSADITHEMIGKLMRMNRVTVTRVMASVLQKASDTQPKA